MQQSNDIPSLLLGTAMWGWTTDKQTAFKLLDTFYDKGFREVDTATNYPINKVSTDFRKSEKILNEWCNSNNINDLRIMVKVGSLDNMRTPMHNLSTSFLLMNANYYQNLYGKNLETLMIHWDNRSDEEAIHSSYLALQNIQEQGLQIGFSGLKHPEIHAKLNATFHFNPRIQLKHNLLYSDYQRYAPFHGKRRFIAYGINGGGIKLSTNYSDKNSLIARGNDGKEATKIIEQFHPILQQANSNANRPKIVAFNQLGMINAFYQSEMNGILIGPSKVSQLESSIRFWQEMQSYSYQEVYDDLQAILDFGQKILDRR